MLFKKTIQILIFSALALIAGQIVFARFGTRVQTLPKLAIDSKLDAPPEIAIFVQRSCGDCHTSSTQFPWYGKVPPLSWMLTRDVENAHRAVDFINWTQKNGSTPVRAAATLLTACSDLETGRMPLARYLWMHPDAKPGKDDIQAFCAWANQESASLTRVQR